MREILNNSLSSNSEQDLELAKMLKEKVAKEEGYEFSCQSFKPQKLSQKALNNLKNFNFVEECAHVSLLAYIYKTLNLTQNQPLGIKSDELQGIFIEFLSSNREKAFDKLFNNGEWINGSLAIIILTKKIFEHFPKDKKLYILIDRPDNLISPRMEESANYKNLLSIIFKYTCYESWNNFLNGPDIKATTLFKSEYLHDNSLEKKYLFEYLKKMSGDVIDLEKHPYILREYENE